MAVGGPGLSARCRTPGCCPPSTPSQPVAPRLPRLPRAWTAWQAGPSGRIGRTLRLACLLRRCESGFLPGPPPCLCTFLWGERTLPHHRDPHHHPGPHGCLGPGRRLWTLGPRPHSAKCLSMSLGTWGERRRVVRCMIFNRLSVWVSVCMTWNKLPTASPLFCVPALSRPQPWPWLAPRFPPLHPAPPLSPPGFATPAPTPPLVDQSCRPELLTTLTGACHPGPPLTWQELSGGERPRGGPWRPPCPEYFLGSIPPRAQRPALPGARCEGAAERVLDRAQGCGEA